jgi:hypothetical protein
VALVVAFVAGILTGPTIQNQWSRTKAPETTVASPVSEPASPAPVEAERRAPRAKASARVDDVVAARRAPDTIRTIPVAVWEPELRDRVKDVLSPGSSLEIAAADFDDTEQFVTVAHAARNTKVPFMVLKDRLLNGGESLTEAIRQFKPELDATAEVRRARIAARADLGLAG